MPEINTLITDHLKESCGIRSIARLLKLSCTTVIKRIISIVKSIDKPAITFGKVHELDEMPTSVKKKSNLRWIVYAICRETKEVVDFTVGN